MDWTNNILAPVVTAIVVSALFYSSDALRKAPSYVVPSGTVAAFNLSKCPDGWKDFEEAKGRVIIGVGKGNELTERLLGQRGGSETHILTIQELPKHDHATFHTKKIFMAGDSAAALSIDKGDEPNTRTGDAGQGEAHNIMQPWIALHYCEKN